jgi:translation initiation factor 1
MNDERYKLVYSDQNTATEKINGSKRAPGTGRAHMRLERKGRGGKTVTVIEGLTLSDDLLRPLLKELQKICGTGGTIKEHHLELQGDFREKIRPCLEKQGYKFT